MTGRRLLTWLVALGLCACGNESDQTTASADVPESQSAVAPTGAREPGPTASAATEAADPEHGNPSQVLDDEAPAVASGIGPRPWTGDFDGMVERRRIRILTPYSKTFYFLDKGEPRGITHDVAVLLEKTINKQLKTKTSNKVLVTVIPTSRRALYDSLVQGLGDIVIAGITVTPERAALVDFTISTKTDVRQVIVTGPGAPPLATLDDLSGQEVTVRAGSIQFESLNERNEDLARQGKAPIRIRTVPAVLEDEDILEMANAGLLKIVVVGDLYAEFWQQILPDITPHPAIVIRDEGTLAWAVRKNSPKLIAILNPIIKANRAGTLFGNLLLRRYLKETETVMSATSEAQITKFNDLVEIFRKYGEKYDIDYLLMMAQGYQESRLDQGAKSRVGAVGIMQVMPATGKELNVGDITKVDSNIEAGVKYIRFMIDRYYADEPMDALNKSLFAFASYNAGPARIRRLRADAAAQGLDPNVWFNNVERVVAAKVGREPVTYVSNIYKYYVAYTLVTQEMAEREAVKAKEAAN